MRRVTRGLLLLFVFTVPWDVVTLPGVGTVSRIVATLALAAAVLTAATEQRFRKPNVVLGLAIAFTLVSALSLLWTVSYDATVQRVATYAQLAGSVWLVNEFARTREQQQSLLGAFCLGAFVPMADLLNNFRNNVQISMAGRFSAHGINANELGLTLVIGIPFAWYLIIHRRGIVRVMALIYFVVAPFAILLTGTRAAFLSGLVALTIVPLTLPRRSWRSYVLAAVLLVASIATTAIVVPESSWARVASIPGEILDGGAMTGRRNIWSAGVQILPTHPLLGVGAGAFGAAVEPLLNKPEAPHNLALGLLVEQGIVGVLVFAGLLAACARTIFGLPSSEQTLWWVVMLAWLVGSMSVNFEYSKVTWLLFGLLAAQRAVTRGGHHVSLAASTRVATAASATHLVRTPRRAQYQ
jgi:O-antigen ligase